MEIQSFIEAIQTGDSAEISRWHDLVVRSLSSYLRIHYRANYQDAEDCAQDALLVLIEMVQKGDQLPDKPAGYVRTIAKNNYFKIFRENKLKAGDEYLETETKGLDPSEVLVKDEMKRLLELCIKKLDDFQEKFIRYWLGNPGVRAEEMGHHFELSTSNVWVKRHRINKQLKDCILKKL